MLAKLLAAFALLGALATSPSAEAACPTGPPPLPDGVGDCVGLAADVVQCALTAMPPCYFVRYCTADPVCVCIPESSDCMATVEDAVEETTETAILEAEKTTQKTTDFLACLLVGSPPPPCQLPP
jgi:hypothetical protein